jgi:hypothetical protein
MPPEISPSDFAALQSDMAHVKKTLDRLVDQVEPVLLARSGDLNTIAGIQRDLDSSHEKHREHARRIDRIEKRVDRTTWLVLGAWAVIQALWTVWGPAITRALRGG